MKTFEKAFMVLVLFLFVFVLYNSVYAYPDPEPILERKKEDKTVCFCNGLNLPQERQCPTMDDLDDGIILR
jgi:hypothetical protein